jgi:hypothetical protein
MIRVLEDLDCRRRCRRLGGSFAGSARMARLPPPMFASYGPAMLPFVPSVDHITSIPSFVKQTDG